MWKKFVKENCLVSFGIEQLGDVPPDSNLNFSVTQRQIA